MKSPPKQHFHQIIFICLLMVVGWGQDCIEDVEVELWGDCYNIEETTEINYSYVSLGEIPSRIGFLINLNYIHISDCGLSGQIPPELGNLVNLVSLQVYDNNLDLPDSLDVDINSNLIGEIPEMPTNIGSFSSKLTDYYVDYIRRELGIASGGFVPYGQTYTRTTKPSTFSSRQAETKIKFGK